MKLEVNENKQLVVNGIVLERVPEDMAATIFHYLFSQYLIARQDIDTDRQAAAVVSEAERILEFDAAEDYIADAEYAIDWDTMEWGLEDDGE